MEWRMLELQTCNDMLLFNHSVSAKKLNAKFRKVSTNVQSEKNSISPFYNLHCNHLIVNCEFSSAIFPMYE